MKVTAIVCLAAYCSLALGKEEPAEKEKRGVAYTTPRPYSTATAAAADVAYATAKVSPQTFAPSAKEYAQPQYQVKYVQAQQQAAPVQYQYEYEQQPYSQQPQQQQQHQQVTKLAPAKAAYAPAPIQFSLASDVSSFSYSSPLVSYSNLGLLKQTIGKSVGSIEQPTAEQSYTQPQVAQQYTSDSKVAYAPQQYISYKQAPQKVVLQAAPAPQKLTYTAAPAKLNYAQAQAQPQQRIVYAQVPQQAPAPSHAQQAYKAGNTIVYASSAEEAYEKIYGKPYVAPAQQQQAYAEPQQAYQQQAHQGQQAQPAQVQYVKLTPQQYAAYTQQLQAHQQAQAQSQPQQQYVDAPQYTGSHSEQQPTYVQPQEQYYHATPGVTYAHQQ